MLQLKSVNKLKVIFALKKCCADNKFLEYSGAHAIAYFHSVGFEFLRSQQVQLAIEMPKSYHRNADVRLFKTDNVYQKVDAKQQMLNTVCQNTHAKNQMLKHCKHDLSSNQHTEKVVKDKKTKEKVNMLQCPSSLKQMNFKMKCFLSLLVTINMQVIIFNIRLSIITKLNHEIQE